MLQQDNVAVLKIFLKFFKKILRPNFPRRKIFIR